MDKSKRQDKGIELGLRFIKSDISLLKRLRKLHNMGLPKNENFIVKTFIKTGGLKVYPIKPFKYGYMSVWKKNYLKSKKIGIRSPLQNKQLKLIDRFVGLDNLKKSNTDEQYLDKLKCLLVQKCNTQIPDELRWNDILAHIEVFLGNVNKNIRTNKKSKSRKKKKAKKRVVNKKRPSDLVTLAVAEKDFHVTRITLLRAIKDNRLTSHRPDGCSTNHPHKVSTSQVASNWPPKDSKL